MGTMGGADYTHALLRRMESQSERGGDGRCDVCVDDECVRVYGEICVTF
jgi:hypothetical protein